MGRQLQVETLKILKISLLHRMKGRESPHNCTPSTTCTDPKNFTSSPALTDMKNIHTQILFEVFSSTNRQKQGHRQVRTRHTDKSQRFTNRCRMRSAKVHKLLRCSEQNETMLFVDTTNLQALERQLQGGILKLDIFETLVGLGSILEQVQRLLTFQLDHVPHIRR